MNTLTHRPIEGPKLVRDYLPVLAFFDSMEEAERHADLINLPEMTICSTTAPDCGILRVGNASAYRGIFK